MFFVSSPGLEIDDRFAALRRNPVGARVRG